MKAEMCKAEMVEMVEPKSRANEYVPAAYKPRVDRPPGRDNHSPTIRMLDWTKRAKAWTRPESGRANRAESRWAYGSKS